MNKTELLEAINSKLAYCDTVIKETAADFDPFAIMMGKESKNQKLYRFCCEFLLSISELCDDFTETIRTCI